jgi:hypothetical protein
MSFLFSSQTLLPVTAHIKSILVLGVVMARQRDCKDFAKYYTRAVAPLSSALTGVPIVALTAGTPGIKSQ